MSKAERVWSLQEAKAKFSEVVRRAQTEGPQTVTVHGRPTVRIAAIEADAVDDRETGQVIVDAFRKCPVKDFEIPRIRSFGSFRDPET